MRTRPCGAPVDVFRRQRHSYHRQGIPGPADLPRLERIVRSDSRRLDAGSYSPIILSTTHVLDAAVRTINALHKKSPFDFGISLGDDCNNTQYNELRWFIDVLDGKVITPSSGADAGADTIDYQKPYKAAGLDKSIPWYQAIGNHDQYWSGIGYENAKLQRAHVGKAILDINSNILADPNYINETGAYMGVVDGSTPYGNIIGAGPEKNFPVPPTVVADPDRRSLVTSASTSRNWMREFFTTASNPVGHGFTQASLDEDFACYSFEPQSDLPIKVIVLDDTNKPDDKLGGLFYCGTGGLDRRRLDWLKSELQKGQDEGKLMIIAAHIPIKPQASLSDTGTFMVSTTRPLKTSCLPRCTPIRISSCGWRDIAISTSLRPNPTMQRISRTTLNGASGRSRRRRCGIFPSSCGRSKSAATATIPFQSLQPMSIPRSWRDRRRQNRGVMPSASRGYSPPRPPPSPIPLPRLTMPSS